jgi:S-adenosyl-L-methionine hydrolase (adenosine-forming)
VSLSIVTLLTDFGMSDSYVAQMKGVILSRCPNCSIIDISHEVPPQDISAGSRMLAEAVPSFPSQTVHVSVVDPGVGTQRRILAVHWEDQYLVLPDNGLLSDLAKLRPPERVFEVSNRELFCPLVSPTFHGRDIMAPVAAFLASGGLLESVGPIADGMIQLSESISASEQADGSWVCRLLASDRFGNLLLTSCDSLLRLLHPGTQFEVRISGDPSNFAASHRVTADFVTTYGVAQQGQLVLLRDSQDRLEMAVVGGSAADRLSIDRLTGNREFFARLYPV